MYDFRKLYLFHCISREEMAMASTLAASVATPTVAARRRAPSHRVGVVAARCAPSASPPETEKAAVAYFGCG